MKLSEILKEHPELLDDDYPGCDVCAAYDFAMEKLIEGVGPDTKSGRDFYQMMCYVFDGEFCRPRCPKCGKPLELCSTNYCIGNVVGGTNSLSSDQEFFMSNFWHCPDCDQSYAMYPVPIEWNANHDIYYTGGEHYLTKDMEGELQKSIEEKIRSSVEQFVRRVKNPEDNIDRNLSSWNLNLWIKRDVSAAVAEILYKYGFKK